MRLRGLDQPRKVRPVSVLAERSRTPAGLHVVTCDGAEMGLVSGGLALLVADTLPPMTDDRRGALALFAATVGGAVTMLVHPSGLGVPAEHFEHVAFVNAFAHGLAVVSVPVAFLGALALWRRLDSPSRLALAGLVAYGLALILVTLAAAASGFVANDVQRKIFEASPENVEVWKSLYRYTYQLNQAFARMYVFASSAAILLWSIAIVRERKLATGLGVYGLVSGVLLVALVGAGHLRLNVHGFGVVVLIQSIWFVVAGVLLWRLDASSDQFGTVSSKPIP
jgi:hypothetical protein